jgi:hypothetical protein
MMELRASIRQPAPAPEPAQKNKLRGDKQTGKRQVEHVKRFDVDMTCRIKIHMAWRS